MNVIALCHFFLEQAASSSKTSQPGGQRKKEPENQNQQPEDQGIGMWIIMIVSKRLLKTFTKIIIASSTNAIQFFWCLYDK